MNNELTVGPTMTVYTLSFIVVIVEPQSRDCMEIHASNYSVIRIYVSSVVHIPLIALVPLALKNLNSFQPTVAV